MKYNEGDLVFTWGRDGDRTARCGNLTFPIWIGKIYKAQSRKKDGVLTWRLYDTFGRSTANRKISKKHCQELIDEGKEWGLPMVHVVHGQICNKEENND